MFFSWKSWIDNHDFLFQAACDAFAIYDVDIDSAISKITTSTKDWKEGLFRLSKVDVTVEEDVCDCKFFYNNRVYFKGNIIHMPPTEKNFLPSSWQFFPMQNSKWHCPVGTKSSYKVR